MRHLILSIFALNMLACAEQHESFQGLPGPALNPQQAQELYLTTEMTIQVVDEQDQPVAGAQVMVGMAPSDPFKGNVLTTDENGLVGIPQDWKAELPVTISAVGFVIKTLPTTLPQPRKVVLSKQEGSQKLEVKGDTTDFGRLVTDGKVDFSLVMPTLSRTQLLNFDLSAVISTEMDSIEVIGNTFEIPSNITLPEQTENYIFPITFDKPQYRHMLRDPGTVKFFAARGQFPIQKVVGDIRNGKSIFEVLNYFTFNGGGYRDVNVSGNVSGQDIKVNQVVFDGSLNVKAPTFGKDQMIFSLSLSEEAGRMTPFDLKRLNSGATTALKTKNGMGQANILSLLLPNAKKLIQPLFDSEMLKIWPMNVPIRPLATQDFSQLSFNLQPAQAQTVPTFIPTMEKPIVNASDIQIVLPTLPADLTAVATIAVLSEIEITGTGNFKNEKRTRLWEVSNEGWVASMVLPAVSFNKNPSRTYRWDVMLLARPSGIGPSPVADRVIDLNSISHATRNATNL